MGSEASSKKIAAGLCGILLGGFGVHKFILGYTLEGAIMLAVTLLGGIGGVICCFPIALPGVMGIIGLIEGIIYLTKSDEDFAKTYVENKRGWF